MRSWLVVGVAVVWVGVFCWLWVDGSLFGSRQVSVGQSVASAVWFVWDELDCDDQEGVADCSDVLEQQVVRAPVVLSVRRSGWRVFVELQVSSNGGVLAHELVTVDDRTGEVVAHKDLV